MKKKKLKMRLLTIFTLFSIVSISIMSSVCCYIMPTYTPLRSSELAVAWTSAFEPSNLLDIKPMTRMYAMSTCIFHVPTNNTNYLTLITQRIANDGVTDKAPSEATFRGSEFLSYDLGQTGGEPIVSAQDAISLYFRTRQPNGLLFYTSK